MATIPDLVRGCYAAYETKDRAALEPLLSDDFTFSSPVDDHIDRATYFARCWPNSEHLDSFEIEKLLVDGDEATVRYLATTTDGGKFRNTETFTIRGGKITHVDVYFGSDTDESINDAEIEAVINAWADGIRHKNVEATAGQFIDEPVNFFLAPPLIADEPIRGNLNAWFATFDGAIGYEVKDLRITASGETAYAHALNHLTGAKTDGEKTDLWFRLTMGFRKIDGRWRIAHAHESVPFLMDGSERAALDLEP